jgi:hypothetical protein
MSSEFISARKMIESEEYSDDWREFEYSYQSAQEARPTSIAESIVQQESEKEAMGPNDHKEELGQT